MPPGDSVIARLDCTYYKNYEKATLKRCHIFQQTVVGGVRDCPVGGQDGGHDSTAGACKRGTESYDQTPPGGADEGKGGRCVMKCWHIRRGR